MLMDTQLPRNFIALLQNWLDICYVCVRWGGSLSYWYLVLCYSWCELGRRVIASFVCNLIFYMDVLIVRLRSSGFGCYLFGVYSGCVMFADTILLLAHTVSAIRHMLKIYVIYMPVCR